MRGPELPTELTENRWHGGLSDERVHRLWRQVREELDSHGKKSSRFRLMAGAATAAALVALAFVIPSELSNLFDLESETSAITRGAVLNTDTAPMEVTLDEGSQLSVNEHSTVQLLEMSSKRVRLSLSSGGVTCDVAEDPARDFAVVTGDIEVRVVGTKFSVSRQTSSKNDQRISKVEVDVERGVVEVWRQGRAQRLQRLTAGQSWASEERLTGAHANTPNRPDEELAARHHKGPPINHQPPSDDASSSAQKVTPGSAPPTTGETRSSPSSDAKQRRATKKSPDPTSERNEARELFEAATQARRIGNAQAAAESYRRFLRNHPGDPRAGLAAFELGRLEMDSLGRPAKALSALKRALRLSPGASFREDVLARITQAYARMGQGKACKRARAAYQKEYPNGVHGHELETLCP